MKTKCLTGDQWLGIGIAKLTLAILLIAAAAGAGGCATMGIATTSDVAAVQQNMANLRSDLITVAGRTRDNTTTIGVVRGEVKSLEAHTNTQVNLLLEAGKSNTAAVKELADRTATNTGGIEMLKSWAKGADGRFTRTDSTLQAQATAITGSKTEIAKVKVTANAAVAKATALTRRVGVVETTHYDHQGRVAVQLDFVPCKVDKDGKFVRGTTILPGTRAAISDLILPDLKKGKPVAYISGFADSQDFLDERGNKLADSDVLNTACANERARAVFQHLVEALDPSEHSLIENAVISDGTKTKRFGSRKFDRSAVVELK